MLKFLEFLGWKPTYILTVSMALIWKGIEILGAPDLLGYFLLVIGIALLIYAIYQFIKDWRSWRLRNRSSIKNNNIKIQTKSPESRNIISYSRVPIINVFEKFKDIGWQLPPKIKNITNLCDFLRQEALDEKITFWGRKNNGYAIPKNSSFQLLEKIPSQHWKLYQINWTAAFDWKSLDNPTLHQENHDICSYNPLDLQNKYNGYQDLYISNNALEIIKSN